MPAKKDFRLTVNKSVRKAVPVARTSTINLEAVDGIRFDSERVAKL
jgi:hypothetical protein